MLFFAGIGSVFLSTWAVALPALQGARSPILDPAGKLDVGLVERLASAAPDEFLPVDIVLAEQCPPWGIETRAAIPSKAVRRSLVVESLKDVAASSQVPLVQFLEAHRDQGRVRGRIQRLWIHNVVAAEVTGEVIRELAARPDVALVHYDPPREDALSGVPPVQARSSPTWSLEQIRAPEVWNRLRVIGRGVVVGVIDTGLCQLHADLTGRLWKNPREDAGNGIDDDGNGLVDDVHGWNFSGDNADIDDAHVGWGHGSHVTGTVAGNGISGVRCGVAPGAQIMVLKFFEGYSGEMVVWRCIEYGLENGADVLNGSLGWPHGYRPARSTWRSVCDNAIAAGAIVVFAAGNDHCDTLYDNVRTPADVPDVIAVGAVDDRDVLAWFSSCGPTTWQGVPGYLDHPYPPGLTKPDVSAPGEAVISHRLCSGYHELYGTSMATPHVAGLAALLLEADPTLDQFRLKAILEATAADLGDPGWDNEYGAGRIDAFSAVERALVDRPSRRR